MNVVRRLNLSELFGLIRSAYGNVDITPVFPFKESQVDMSNLGGRGTETVSIIDFDKVEFVLTEREKI